MFCQNNESILACESLRYPKYGHLSFCFPIPFQFSFVIFLGLTLFLLPVKEAIKTPLIPVLGTRLTDSVIRLD